MRCGRWRFVKEAVIVVLEEMDQTGILRGGRELQQMEEESKVNSA
jgi:phenylpyruvate tautomerase PptA (4-oxalocrotonate tautomerase family)